MRWLIGLTFLLTACAPAPEAELDLGKVTFLSERTCTIELVTLAPDASVEMTLSQRPSLTSDESEPRIRLESAGFRLPDRFDFLVDGEELFRGRFIFDQQVFQPRRRSSITLPRRNRRKGHFRLSATQRETLSAALASSTSQTLELRGERSPMIFAVPNQLSGFLEDPGEVCQELAKGSA